MAQTNVGSVTPRFFKSVTLDPASVNGTTYATQTFTVNGLTTDMAVLVNVPNLESGMIIANVAVSAANTLKVWFYNQTGAPINPASQEFKIIGF